MKTILTSMLFLLTMTYTNAQFGLAPSGLNWTPYVLNYQPEKWTDWSDAGRQGGIPSSFSCYVSINDVKYTGTFTQKLIKAIEDANLFGVEHNTVLLQKKKEFPKFV